MSSTTVLLNLLVHLPKTSPKWNNLLKCPLRLVKMKSIDRGTCTVVGISNRRRQLVRVQIHRSSVSVIAWVGVPQLEHVRFSWRVSVIHTVHFSSPSERTYPIVFHFPSHNILLHSYPLHISGVQRSTPRRLGTELLDGTNWIQMGGLQASDGGNLPLGNYTRTHVVYIYASVICSEAERKAKCKY
jgi:hypothetical protein